MTTTEINPVFEFYYVARQPVFNNSGEIWGHELLYHSGSNDQVNHITNENIASLCVATSGFSMSQFYQEASRKICMHFTESLLLDGSPQGLPAPITVIEIPGEIMPSPRLIKMLASFKEEGYTLAMDAYSGTAPQKQLLDAVDIVKIDISTRSMQEIEHIFSVLKEKKILKLANKVENRSDLKQLRSLGCDLYQGPFFAKPVKLRGRKLKPTEISKFRILQAFENPNLELETIQEIIKADPSITYQLLKLLNSVVYGFSVRIESVKRAVNLIGLKQLTYWLRMVVMSDLSVKSQTPELYTLGLTRGRFLEELAMKGEIKSTNPETLFLFGMLSLIEPMLEMPMKMVLEELPLSDEIKNGYVDNRSIYSKYLKLSIAIENFDLQGIDKICLELGMNKKAVATASSRSIAWANKMAQAME
ncbi:EAL and HDOD domain-containing protein [Desulfocicer niacini]